MHVLFVHQNYPAQFGHVARYLVRALGWQCTFVSKTPDGDDQGVRKIAYTTAGGAREVNHYCSRTFENAVWNTHGVYEACRAHPEIRPDLIVGHSGFGSTLFLPELYPGVPIVNYFEYFYRAHGSDLDFRPEFPPAPLDYLRARARNATVLLDLDNCRVGYCPTEFQRSLFPDEYRPKLDVIFDGIDTEVFRRVANPPRVVGGVAIPASTRVVTYVSRGFESMRGFDIFMKTARLVAERFPDAVFVVVGSDQISYGGDRKFIKHATFREHVLAQDGYDLSRFIFPGTVPPATLVELLSLSDLHIYLTVPFVLSWSLVNALACGCTVLASDTAPVREVVRAGENGLLADFFDVDGFAEQALAVLRDPAAYRGLGEAGARTVRERYSLEVCLPRLVRLFESAAGGPASG